MIARLARWLSRTLWIILPVGLALLIFLGITGYMLKIESRIEAEHLQISLDKARSINDLVVYREVVSHRARHPVDRDRRVHTFEKAELEAEPVTFVAMAMVEASVELSKIEAEADPETSTLVLRLPEIRIGEPVILEEYSFFWNSGTAASLAEFHEKVKPRLKLKALNRGLLEKGRRSASTFLLSFFKNAGYRTVIVKHSLADEKEPPGPLDYPELSPANAPANAATPESR